MLLYAALPSDRMPEGPPLGAFPLLGTDPAYLTIRVPYEADDLEATPTGVRVLREPVPAARAPVWSATGP